MEDDNIDETRSRSRSPVRRSRSRSPTRNKNNRQRSFGGGRRVVVRNIPYDVKWQDLKDMFRNGIGDVTYVEMLETPEGKSKGVAVVEFRDPLHAEKAVEEFHQKKIKDRAIIVREEREKDRQEFAQNKIMRERGRFGPVGDNSMGGGRGMGLGSVGLPAQINPQINPQILHQLGIDGPITSTVFVANLDYSVTLRKLTDVFKLAGNVIRAEIKEDKNGQSRGMGVVVFEHPMEAVQAVSMFNGQLLYERNMVVRVDKDLEPEQPKLPSGLKSIGMGLGSGGVPLTNFGQLGNSLGLSGGSGLLGMGGGGMGGGGLGGSGLGLLGAGSDMLGMGGGFGGGLGNSLGGMGLGSGGSLSSGRHGGSSGGMGLGGGLGGSLSDYGLGGLGGSSKMGGLSDSFSNNYGGFGDSNYNGNGGLSGLGSNLSSLTAGLGGMGGSGSLLGGMGDALGLGRDRLGIDRMGVLGDRMGGLGDRMGDLGGRMGGLGDRMGGLGDRMGGLDRISEQLRDNYGGGGGRDDGNRRITRPDNCTVVVKNLPYSVTWQALKEHFRDAGDVKFAEIIVDKGKSTGVGLVRFRSEADAQRAISLKNKSGMERRNIDVSLHRN